MNIDDLHNDEFQVECLVRGFTGTAGENYRSLKTQLTEEATSAVLIPNRPHPLAAKNPRREIQVCASKLHQLQVSMRANISVNEESELLAIRSRLMHVRERLDRLHYSPAAKSDPNYEVVIKYAVILSAAIQKALTEKGSLDASKEAIEQVDLSQFENVEDNLWDAMDETNKRDRKVHFASAHSSPTANQFQRMGTLTQVREGIWCEDDNPQLDELLSLLDQMRFNSPVQPIAGTPSTSSNVTTGTQLFPGSPGVTMPDVNMPPPCSMATVTSGSLHSIPSITTVNAIPNTHTVNTIFTNPTSQTGGTLPSNFRNAGAYNEPWASADLARGYPTETSKNLKNWNIKFDGDGNVERFLHQVEFLAQSHNVPATRLVTEFSVLLRGEAYEWYWTYVQRHGVVSWPQLKNQFLDMYRERRSDDEIKRDIESRKQRYLKGESFLAFYKDIVAKSLHFSFGYSDVELLRILKQNMRPGLQIALEGQNISSISQLIHKCTSYEDKWKQLNYNPEFACQSTRHVHEVVQGNPSNCPSDQVVHAYSASCGESAFTPNPCPSNWAVYPPPVSKGLPHPNFEWQHSPDYTGVSPEIHAFQQRANAWSAPSHNNYLRTQPPPKLNPRDELNICWNCRDIGHWYKDCLKPFTNRFCFGCGLVNSVKPRCPRCQVHPGNAVMEGAPPGKAFLQKPEVRKLNSSPSQNYKFKDAATQRPSL